MTLRARATSTPPTIAPRVRPLATLSVLVFATLAPYMAYGAPEAPSQIIKVHIRTESFEIEVSIDPGQTKQIIDVPILPEDEKEISLRVGELPPLSRRFLEDECGDLTGQRPSDTSEGAQYDCKNNFRIVVQPQELPGLRQTTLTLKRRLLLPTLVHYDRDTDCNSVSFPPLLSLQPIKKENLKVCLGSELDGTELGFSLKSQTSQKTWSAERRVLESQSAHGMELTEGKPITQDDKDEGKGTISIVPRWLALGGKIWNWRQDRALPDWTRVDYYYWPSLGRIEPLDIPRSKFIKDPKTDGAATAALKAALPCLRAPNGWSYEVINEFKKSLFIRTGFNRIKNDRGGTKINWVPAFFDTADGQKFICPVPNKDELQSIFDGISEDNDPLVPSWPLQLDIYWALFPETPVEVKLVLVTGIFPALRESEWQFSIRNGDMKEIKEFDLTQPMSAWARWLCITQPKSILPEQLRLDSSTLRIDDEIGNTVLSFANGELIFRKNWYTAENKNEHMRCVSLAAKGIFNEKNQQLSSRLDIIYKDTNQGFIRPKFLSTYLGSQALALSYVSVATSGPVGHAYTSGVSDEALAVRAMAPLAGLSVALPLVMSLNAEVGVNVGARFTSAEDRVLTGVTTGLHAALCLRIESKLTPRICGMVGPDFIFGQQAGTADSHGFDAALSWSVLAGAL